MSTFSIWAETRSFLDTFARKLNPATVNIVPAGYRNSIHWNIAHIVVTQQLLTYGLTGNALPLPSPTVEWCRKGSDASGTPPQWQDTLDSILGARDRFLVDYRNGAFTTFTPYTSSTGIEFTSVDEAMGFNTFHEGIHVGYVLSMKKAL